MVCLSLSGCIEFYTYHPVAVSVCDAETDAPITGAHVEVSYLYMMVLNAPQPTSALTDGKGCESGYGELRGAGLNASANDYLPQDETEHDNPLPTKMAFRLYRLPEPRVTIIVPNGYHGPLMIDLRPVSQWVQDNVGKREFTYRMASNGYVGIDATPLLLNLDTPKNINAVFEDGTPIPCHESRVWPSATALRYVDGTGYKSGTVHPRLLFVIGSEQEKEAMYRAVNIFECVNGDPNWITQHHNFDAYDALFVAPATQPSPATRP